MQTTLKRVKSMTEYLKSIGACIISIICNISYSITGVDNLNVTIINMSNNHNRIIGGGRVWVNRGY